MTELTQEYLDKSLKNLPTKQDLKDAVEDLARIVNDGFDSQQKYLEEKLDVRDRMAIIEKDMARIKEALHIK